MIVPGDTVAQHLRSNVDSVENHSGIEIAIGQMRVIRLVTVWSNTRALRCSLSRVAERLAGFQVAQLISTEYGTDLIGIADDESVA